MKRIKIVSPKYGIKYMLIDNEDYQLIVQYKWSVNLCGGIFYAVNTTWKDNKYKTIKSHRLIMDVLKKPKIFIDHIDRNGLNNMRSNLRFTTVALNACNTRFLSKSKSGYRGVYLYRNGYMVGQYTACILVKRNKIFGGYFPTAIEAAKKYNELALKYHGEFARLNPI